VPRDESRSAFSALEDEYEPRRQTPNGHDHEAGAYRFDLIDASQLKLNRAAAYLVKHIIPAQGLIVVWGPPKCGKSFWILDVAFHIALGWQYRGRRVKQGLALYIGCEGEFAVPARVEAFRQWKIRGPIDPDKFKLILTRLDLINEADQLILDVEAQLGTSTPAIIIIDTLNRSLAGSESSDEDMGNYVKAADKLRERFGCAVAIIHHCGINDSRPRGHTSLAGAADAQIAVKKDASGVISTEVEFMKDGPEGEHTFSRFKVIANLDLDEDGEPITSCIIDEVDSASAKRPGPKSSLPASQKRALELLVAAIDKAGTIPASCDHIPANKRCVPESLWREYCYKGQLADSDKPDAQRQAFNRAAGPLISAGFVGKWGDYVWVCQGQSVA
jgi:hypothetical protein